MYAKKKSMSMKVVVLLLAVVLLIGCTIGGTIAYLMTNTNSVTNTFVVGDIGTLTLKENASVANNNTNTFTIIPGNNLTKNVTVSYSYTDDATDKMDDVAVYVFVKVDTTGWTVTNNKDYAITGTVKDAEGNDVTQNLLSWSIDSGWTYLTTDGNARVYSKAVEANGSLTDAAVISNSGTITVSSAITESNIDAIATAAGDIVFTAYAIQQDSFNGNVVDAWNAVKDTAVPTP